MIFQTDIETLKLQALKNGFEVTQRVYSDKYEMWFDSQEIKDKVEKHWYEGPI